MPSSVVTSPSLPMDRLAQCCATKWQCSTLVKSSTEDSGAEGTYGSAESTFGSIELEMSPVDQVLQKLTMVHEGLVEAVGVGDPSNRLAG